MQHRAALSPAARAVTARISALAVTGACVAWAFALPPMAPPARHGATTRPAADTRSPSTSVATSSPAAATRAAAPGAADWPMFGGSPSRNSRSAATGLPVNCDPNCGANICWTARVGSTSYGGPVVASGRVYIGTNNAAQLRPHSRGDRGVLLCFDDGDGRLLWQATHDKLPAGPEQDWPEQGIASTPCVMGDRVYYVSNRGELVCADADGFRDDQNDGPFRGERFAERDDADFVWILDMVRELGVQPHNLSASSPVVVGRLVFVGTGNGVDEQHEKPPAPGAPSFLAVDCETGAVVWKRADPGPAILHGQWSSPACAVVDGVAQVIFAGGDGWCYSFVPGTGELLWKFDLNPKDSEWEPGGAGTRSSIVATPVIARRHVYLAVGDDPESPKGPGHLYAIDATRRGDITESGQGWHFGGRDFGRTTSSAVVAGGLVYAVDLEGFLYCLEAETGSRVWRHDLGSACWASPLLADGRIYIGTTDGELVVMTQGKILREVARTDLGYPIHANVAAVNDSLYVLTSRALFKLRSGG